MNFGHPRNSRKLYTMGVVVMYQGIILIDKLEVDSMGK
jgi:hypothetical protein